MFGINVSKFAWNYMAQMSIQLQTTCIVINIRGLPFYRNLQNLFSSTPCIIIINDVEDVWHWSVHRQASAFSNKLSHCYKYLGDRETGPWDRISFTSVSEYPAQLCKSTLNECDKVPCTRMWEYPAHVCESTLHPYVRVPCTSVWEYPTQVCASTQHKCVRVPCTIM